MVALIFMSGCGASSPTTPAQIPTSVEYAGGEVSGAISVQMDKGLSFVVKDADGNTITDPEITVELLDTSASANVSGAGKSLVVMADQVVTDGSCGTTSISGSEIAYTAPNNWKGVASTCKLRGIYNGETLEGQSDIKISLSPTKTGSLLFSSAKILSNFDGPALDVDNSGNLFICGRSLDGSWGLNVYKSSDLGVTFTSPVTLATGHFDYNCSIGVSGDGSTVAVAWWHEGENNDIDVAMSSDNGASFSSASTAFSKPSSGTDVGVAVDSNNVVHVVSSITDGDVNYYVAACTASSCGTPFKITSRASPGGFTPKISISSDDKIYIIWRDRYQELCTDAYIAQLTYVSNSYSIANSSQITDCTANLSTNDASPVVNRDGTVFISRSDSTTTPLASDIYSNTWNPNTGAFASSVLVSDIASSLNSLVSRPFISYDNNMHVLYVSYGASYDDANVWHTMDDGNGGFTVSRNIELTKFNYQNTTIKVKTDLVGRPYIIWNGITPSSDLNLPIDINKNGGGGPTTSSDIYLGVGYIQ